MVYRSGSTEFNVATSYETEPSCLYDVGTIQLAEPGFDVPGASKTFLVEHVGFQREIERSMVAHGDTYDVGRIGAEIAFAIAKKRLGLRNLILPDPNAPGKDLFTEDCKVLIQARMLTKTQFVEANGARSLIQRELLRLIRKLREDFRYNLHAETGFAVLTYVDREKRCKTLLLKTARQ